MNSYDKDKIKKTLIKKYKTKLKPSVLEANIDSLVDEFIENKKFIKENKLKVSDLPKPTEVSSWFEDELSAEEIAQSIKDDDPWVKVDLYKIYHKDKLAKEIYKNIYDIKWCALEPIPKDIELLIKLLKMAESNSTTQFNKDIIIARLVNLALIGTVRFYHLERRPYLKESQFNSIIKYFFKVLSLINSIKNGKYKDKNISGEIYIFKSLDTSVNTKTDDDDNDDDDTVNTEDEKDES